MGTVTGFGTVELSPTRRVIEVTQGGGGLPALLENAVLLFASGHADQARALLEDGVASDPETRQSPLAWLVLLDLLQRAGDRPAFDQVARRYDAGFGRPAPAWDTQAPRASARPAAGGGGYANIVGKPPAAAGGPTPPAPAAAPAAPTAQGLAWSGVIAGPHPAQAGQLSEYAEGRDVVPVDLAQVERIDFVGAAACYNTIRTLEARGKTVRIVGATPVIRAMLQLIGLAPAHFQPQA